MFLQILHVFDVSSDGSDGFSQQLELWNKSNADKTSIFSHTCSPFFVTAPLPFLGFPFPLFGFKGVLRIYYFDKLRDNFYFVQFSIRKMTNLCKNLWSYLLKSDEGGGNGKNELSSELNLFSLNIVPNRLEKIFILFTLFTLTPLN